MSPPTVHYDISVDVRSDLAIGAPGMGNLVDIIAEGLGMAGYDETDYEVEVKGPPELDIRVVMM